MGRNHSYGECGPHRTLIAEIPRGPNQRAVVEIVNGNEVDIRLWYRDKAGTFRPSGTGIRIRPNHLSQIIQALAIAGRAIDEVR
ncbi:PC4/YdbC family ssDNA-binding protein [Burkholderia diffusa]|uniref:PC4/YdbC family ssDNA-binding protein n=1 Tax=Burkholderia diffusa TaxID=488732 RepID=UPI001589ED35